MAFSPRLVLLLSALTVAAAAPRAHAGLTFYDGATFAQVQTHPRVAVDTVPTRLLFAVESHFTSSQLPPVVQRDGNRLKMYLPQISVPGCGWPHLVCYNPPPARPMQADLGLLEAGEYEVELYLGPPGTPILRDQVEITVVPGPRLFPVRAAIAAGEEAALVVEFPPGTCPHAAPARLAESTIKVPVSLGDCGNVATTSRLPALQAGSYDAVLEIDGQVYARSALEVIPDKPRLAGGRFEVDAAWRTAAGASGKARLVQTPSADSALFYFFSETNWELMVKVLDGCAINGHFWVFSAASTDVGFTVAVQDLATGQVHAFANAPGTPAGAINNLEAFPCP